MKDWIKLTGTDDSDVIVRVSRISHFSRKTDRNMTIIYITGNEGYFVSVKEGVDEILQLIDSDPLLERLKDVKAECSVNCSGGYCTGCTRMKFCDTLTSDPLYWDMNKIEDELR